MSLSSKSLPDLKPLQIVLEILFVVLVAIFAVSPFLDLGQPTRLGGIESEYLTRSAYSLAVVLPEKGYLPLWQPYLERGDPLMENPVSFAFNPLASLPPLFFGLYDGMKISLLLAAICAGIGGWALARVLGLSWFGRLLIACLVIGKGNFHAYLVEGHFPLVIVQAFFPWIFTALVSIFKGYRRWAVALLIVSFVFVFWSGIPWYPPAILLSIGIFSLFGMFVRASGTQRLQVQWKHVGRVIAGVVGALLLSAALMFPLLTKGDNIGQSSVEEDFRADIGGILGSFFSSEKDYTGSGLYPQGFAYSYYNYMSPIWYAALIAALSLIVVLLSRKRLFEDARFFWGFLAVFIFTMLWGAGQNPLIELFYRTIPYASQFRHVERVFAISSLMLIVILGMVADAVWRYLVQAPLWAKRSWAGNRYVKMALRAVLGIGLLLVSAVAVYDVVLQWHISWGEFFTQPEDQMEDACVTWLRETYPDRELSLWTLDYKNIYTYLRNRVRHAWVASDFYHAEGLPSTIFDGSMQRGEVPPTELLPEFAIGITHYDDSWLAGHGYVPMEASINPYTDGRPCIYQREGAYSYAWTTTLAQLDQYTDFLPVTETTPIDRVIRDYDRIGILAQASPDQDVVVTVSEVAYPGWEAFINGAPARIESLGGQVAVVLPRSDQYYTVMFRYLPDRFFLGSIITLITAVVCILYLLNVDRLFRRRASPSVVISESASGGDSELKPGLVQQHEPPASQTGDQPDSAPPEGR